MASYFMTFQIKSLDRHSYRDIDQRVCLHLAVDVCNKIISGETPHLRVSALLSVGYGWWGIESLLSVLVTCAHTQQHTLHNINCSHAEAWLCHDVCNFQLSCYDRETIILEIKSKNGSRWMYFMQYYIIFIIYN